jgi:hypothetical protein
MPAHPTCFLQITGGLCNHLFEIAAALAHCKRTGQRLVISHSEKSNFRPSYWDSYLWRFKHCTTHDPHTELTPIWKEPHYHYAPIPSAARSLEGFFQSTKHFADYADEIRYLFRPRLRFRYAVEKRHADLLTLGSRAVIVHVRRGDYFLPKHVGFHGLLDWDYYRDVMTEMRRRVADPVFLVFSDDLEACQQNMRGTDIRFVSEPDDCAALYLMSQFHHYILSNSSFSWWATWLGEPAHTVIAPDTWFGNNRQPMNWQDIYEPTWIRWPITSARAPVALAESHSS